MMVKSNQRIMAASRAAAAANLFASEWGSRLIRRWVKDWVNQRELPVSRRGQHSKISSILTDPTARAAIRDYLRSKKWTVRNPAKLQQLFKNELSPNDAAMYTHELVNHNIPLGLKHYIETTLLPSMHVKPSHLGLSLSSMHRLMLREGFKYSEHKKAVYYDGHERPDVVADRNNRFLPLMNTIHPYLTQYKVGEVSTELSRDPTIPAGTPRYVLVAHDEMTVQAHDGLKFSWILDGEQPLKKKGAGRGLHQSDFICSTIGWLVDASETLEYGKNYDGFWNGKLFVQQVCCLILQMCSN